MARAVVLTPNPGIDVTYAVDAHLPGTTHRVTPVGRRAGGKGLNVARALGALDVDVVNLLPLGGASGRWLAHQLDDDGIAHRVVWLTGETRTTVAVTAPGDHPTLYNEPGPRVSAAEWDALDAALVELLAAASVLVVAGSLPGGASPELLGRWVGRARKAGVPVVVDTSGAGLLVAAAAGATHLLPNATELADATGCADVLDGADVLLDAGAGTVVVSCGESGVVARSSGPGVRAGWRVGAVAGVVGNPTGAGDAATAGLVAALLLGHDLDEGIRWASAMGAAAVLGPLAGDLDLGAFHRFRAQLTTTTTSD